MGPSRSRLIGILSVAFLITGPLRPASGDNLTFTPACSSIWQDCCACGPNLQINWNRPCTPGVCPAQPGTADVANVTQDCIVSGSPFPIAVAGTLAQSNGTFTIDGTLAIGTAATFDGPIDWQSAGIVRADGIGAIVTVNNTVALNTDEAKWLGGNSAGLLGGITLINQSTMTWTDDGDFTIGVGPGGVQSILYNNDTGVIDVQTDAAILSNNQFGLGSLINIGTIQKTAGTGTSAWRTNLINFGLVHIDSGHVRLTGDGDATGEFRVDAGSTLRFATSGYELKPGVSFTGDGDVILEDTGPNNGMVVNDTVEISRLTIVDSGQIGVDAGQPGLLKVSNLLATQGAIIDVPLEILQGAAIEVTGDSQTSVNDLTLRGVANVTAATLATVEDDILITETGLVNLADGGILGSFGLVPRPIENLGSIQKTTGSGTAQVSGSFNVPLNHRAGALIQCTSGTLSLPIIINSEGAFEAGAGAVIELLGANASNRMKTGTEWNGAGAYRILDNFFELENVDLTVENLQIGDATRAAMVQAVSGSSNSLTVTGQLDLVQGGFDVDRVIELTIPDGAALNLSSAQLMILGNTATTLGGTATVTGTGGIQTRTVSQPFIIESTGTFEIQVDSVWEPFFVNQPIQNAGLFTKTVGAGTWSINRVNFTNTGVVRVESGTLAFNGNAGNFFTQNAGSTELAGGSILSSVPLTLNGGVLRGAGDLVANVNNAAGVVQPGASPGVLNIASNAAPAIAGTYSQGGNGVLAIEVGGLDRGTDHDQLVVAGTATLDGTLEVTLINGFVPDDGDTIVVVTAAQVTGEFSSIDATNLPAGVDVDATYSATTVSLEFSVAQDNTNENDNDNLNDNDNANTNENENDNENLNGNANTNTNDNATNENNTNDNSGDNENDNGQPVPGPVPECGDGACGAGSAAMLPLLIVAGAAGLRRRIERSHRRL